MRETKFINKNKNKWVKFEQILKAKKKDPEELSHLFIEITDDLSYSRTFYPNRSVRVYLNNIAQQVFHNIYKNRKNRFKRFVSFWTNAVPQTLYESRFDLLLAFLIFILAVAIGILSSVMDSEFPRIILGDGYVEMTYKNIENGTPMSVYQQDTDQTDMFMGIALNNLRVAFITFILGLLFGGGTIYILLYNGIMVGAFQYLFIREGIYLDSILTIWLHGTIEMSCVIIAGAAGIHLGKGLLFPNTYTRLQSLQLAARRALLIYVTIVPLIVMAAFIEGFITRYSDASYVIRALLIILSFVFMAGYFVWYPWIKAKRGFTANLREVNLPPTINRKIQFDQIKSSSTIFTDAFSFYRKNIQFLASIAGILAFVYTSILASTNYQFSFAQSQVILFFFEAFDNTITNVKQFIILEDFNLLWLLNVITISSTAFFCLHRLGRYANPEKPSANYYIQTILTTIIISTLINSLMIKADENYILGLVYTILVLPFLILWLTVVFNSRTNIVRGFIESLKLLVSNWSVMLGVYLVTITMCFLFLFLTTAPVLNLYLEIVLNLLPFDESNALNSQNTFYIFVHSFMLSLLFPLVFIVISMAQHSFRETQSASGLLNHIPNIGNQKRSYGMARERE